MGINIEDNYTKYKEYIKKYVQRDGVDSFLDWLDSTDAKVAPCSTKYHLSCEGGLIQHSLNVFNRMIRILSNEYDDIPFTHEQIALLALLHDVSKINFYEVSYRNVKDDQTGQWSKQAYYSVKSDDERYFYGTHSETSLNIIKHFFELSYDEELAILYHMGGLDNNDYKRDYCTAFRKSKLAFFLHLADFEATILDE